MRDPGLETLMDLNGEVIVLESGPATLSELAEKSGRQKSNLSRTLKTMEGLGLVRL